MESYLCLIKDVRVLKMFLDGQKKGSDKRHSSRCDWTDFVVSLLFIIFSKSVGNTSGRSCVQFPKCPLEALWGIVVH